MKEFIKTSYWTILKKYLEDWLEKVEKEIFEINLDSSDRRFSLQDIKKFERKIYIQILNLPKDISTNGELDNLNESVWKIYAEFVKSMS